VNTENEEHSDSEPAKSSSEEEDNLENGNTNSKRMSKLDDPTLAEWDTAPYPPKFKASTLHTFDDKGSPN